MKGVIQRVKSAEVKVEGEVVGSIGAGLLVLLGISSSDSRADLDYMVDKILNMRIFPSNEKNMDVSVREIGGEILIVSQFTLLANVQKGRRPSFTDAAPSTLAKELYKAAIEMFGRGGLKIQSGVFGAMMEVGMIGDGPVTIILDSAKNI
ncbi:MAG: D-aminoacyl-tRNA deacylase [Actinomycetota bacterium]|nr:D-aminoacyl-tRNA deacylase [Actinomycetota bacterium]